MSTEYAVKMPLPEFLKSANEMGWELALRVREARDGGRYPRLYLHDGSARGYAWDIREEQSLDGAEWTLFTRYGLDDPSILVSAFRAMSEYDDRWLTIFGWTEDAELANVRRHAAAYFESFTDGGIEPDADELIAAINDELAVARKALAQQEQNCVE